LRILSEYLRTNQDELIDQMGKIRRDYNHYLFAKESYTRVQAQRSSRYDSSPGTKIESTVNLDPRTALLSAEPHTPLHTEWTSGSGSGLDGHGI
jgi:hypothetical protein